MVQGKEETMSEMDNGVALRLFCLPYAGGTARFCQPLRAVLPPAVELVPLEYPGHGQRSREACCTEFGALIDDCCAAILPRARGGRCLLFGHSMGGQLAYHCAHRLEEAGIFPAGVLLSSPPFMLGENLRSRLDSKNFMNNIAALGGLPPSAITFPELRDYMETLLRADFTAMATWDNAPLSAVQAPLTVTAGQDGDIPLPQLLRWAARTRGVFHAQQFAGGHFYLEQHWPVLGALLCRMAGIPPVG